MMQPDLRHENTWSFNGGRDIVQQKGLIDELPVIAESYIEHGGGNMYLSERRELLEPLGWDQEVLVKFEKPTESAPVSRRASFDAYKKCVLVEHESGELMRANWHLMKMEAAHRDSSVFSGARTAEVGVLLIPDYVNFPTLDRTINDVQAFLENYFDFSIPLFVWEYSTG